MIVSGKLSNDLRSAGLCDYSAQIPGLDFPPLSSLLTII
jgi:hypothetical protein